MFRLESDGKSLVSSDRFFHYLSSYELNRKRIIKLSVTFWDSFSTTKWRLAIAILLGNIILLLANVAVKYEWRFIRYNLDASNFDIS